MLSLAWQHLSFLIVNILGKMDGAPLEGWKCQLPHHSAVPPTAEFLPAEVWSDTVIRMPPQQLK